MSEFSPKTVGYDVSDVLYHKKRQKLSFYYVPSGMSNPITVSFKAFITQFDDQYSSNWATNSTYGRMDPIATFENTTRTINLGFTLPAFDYDEALTNMGKMSTLINMLYPVYDNKGRSASQISGAPLVKIKFGNLITATGGKGSIIGNVAIGGLLGYLSGLNFTPNIEAGFYDPGNEGELYPMELGLSFAFNVLHQKTAGFNKKTKNDIKNMDRYGTLKPPSSTNWIAPNFPYGAPALTDENENRSISTPVVHPPGSRDCEKENSSVSALGKETDPTCNNGPGTSPTTSFRDSVAGGILGSIQNIDADTF